MSPTLMPADGLAAAGCGRAGERARGAIDHIEEHEREPGSRKSGQHWSAAGQLLTGVKLLPVGAAIAPPGGEEGARC